LWSGSFWACFIKKLFGFFTQLRYRTGKNWIYHIWDQGCQVVGPGFGPFAVIIGDILCCEENAMINISEKGGKVSFVVKVQPRASKDELAGVLGDGVKLRLTAPPVDGEANKGVIRFFSDLFQVPKSAVTIVSGLTSRTKMVEITGVKAEEVLNVLASKK
jgi:uncharacterized protein (TIGR00251 family)